MENPATWDDATQVVHEALTEARAATERRVFGLSTPRRVTDALRDAGFCLIKHDPIIHSQMHAVDCDGSDNGECCAR